MRPRVLQQLALTILREFVRSKEAVFWTYGFPVLMSVVLGLAFSRGEPAPAVVAVVSAPPGGAPPDGALTTALRGEPLVDVRVFEERAAHLALARGDVDLVVSGTPAQPRLNYDPARAESALARARVEDLLQADAGRRDAVAIAAEAGSERFVRYVDLLIPGLIGLNLLGAGLWGIGFNLVEMRQKHLLRRLVVAPMGKAEFLGAMLLSRLGLVVLDALLILLFGVLAFGVPMQGSWLLLLALFVLGGLAFSGLGLAVASRPRTIEGVSGIMNLVMLPMWLLCGSFFRASYFPEWMQPLVHALPLTHMNDAMRAVMLDGQGLVGIAPQVAFLVAFTAACFGVALRWFRWT